MSATIGRVAYIATWDATSLTKGILNAQQMFRAQKRITEDMQSPLERYQNGLTNLEAIVAKYPAVAGRKVEIEQKLQREYLSQESAVRKLTRAESQRLKFLQASQSVTESVAGSESKLARVRDEITRLAAAYLSFATVKKSIQMAVEAEQAAVQFEVLTGSVDAANFALMDTKQLAAQSPLSLLGVRSAANTMLSFGLSVNETTKSLRMLADISGGNEERFKSLTLAFSQMSTAGRLQGQDLLQMVNAGFNPLLEITKRTGESMMQLRDRMSAGGISSREAAMAFMDATEAGGRFHGMTDRLADTMGGKLAQSMSLLQDSAIEFGDALSPVVLGLTDGFEKGNSILQDTIGLVRTISEGLGFTMAAIKDIASFNPIQLGARNAETFGPASMGFAAGGGRREKDIADLQTEADIRNQRSAVERFMDERAKREAKRAERDAAMLAGKPDVAMFDVPNKDMAATAKMQLDLERGSDMVNATPGAPGASLPDDAAAMDIAADRPTRGQRKDTTLELFRRQQDAMNKLMHLEREFVNVHMLSSEQQMDMTRKVSAARQAAAKADYDYRTGRQRETMDIEAKIAKELGIGSGLDRDRTELLREQAALRERMMGLTPDQQQQASTLFVSLQERQQREEMARKQDEQQPASRTTSSINAGSQEAYQFMVGRLPDPKQLQKQHAENQQQLARSNDLLLKLLQAIEDIEPIGTAG